MPCPSIWRVAEGRQRSLSFKGASLGSEQKPPPPAFRAMPAFSLGASIEPVRILLLKVESQIHDVVIQSEISALNS
jgi:hypothetical protein